MNGSTSGSLDSIGILLDLPNAKNITRSFSCHQETVGKKIRAMVIKEMELAL